MFRVFGGILILAGPMVFVALPHQPIYFLIIGALSTAGFVMIFLRYGLIIDVDKKSYMIYTILLWWRFGKSVAFDHLEKFYINEVNATTVMTTGAGITHDLRKTIFKAYVKLGNGEKLHVDSDQNVEKLKARVANYEQICQTVLHSNT